MREEETFKKCKIFILHIKNITQDAKDNETLNEFVYMNYDMDEFITEPKQILINQIDQLNFNILCN